MVKSKDDRVLLRKLRTLINNNLRRTLQDENIKGIIPPVRKHVLPANNYIRGLYNEAYFTLYAGLLNASILTSCVCHERITRDIYRKFIGDDSDVKWVVAIDQIVAYFRKKGKAHEDAKAVLELMKNMHIIREDTRNFVMHGQFDKFIEDSFFVHNAYNLHTGEVKQVQLSFDPKIHTDKRRMYEDKMWITAVKLIRHLTLIIIRFNKHLSKNNILSSVENSPKK